MADVMLTRFETPDEVRTFEKGRFEVVRIGGMTLGRATYEPGWKWSEHVGAALGKKSCDVEHVGLVISGRAAVAMDDGRKFEIAAGDLFYIAPGTIVGWLATSLTFRCTSWAPASMQPTKLLKRSNCESLVEGCRSERGREEYSVLLAVWRAATIGAHTSAAVAELADASA